MPQRDMDGLSLGGVVERLVLDHGVDVAGGAFPAECIFGAFCKRERVARQGYDPRRGEPVAALRTRLCTLALDMQGTPAERTAMLFAPTWNDAAAYLARYPPFSDCTPSAEGIYSPG